MKAEEVFKSVKGKIKGLDKKEKIRLCSRIIPEFDLIFKGRKRGRVKSVKLAKQKLSKDFYWALAQEKGLNRTAEG